MENDVTLSKSDEKKSRSYYGVRPDFTDNDSTGDQVYSGGEDSVNDLDLNDGKNRYVVVAPDQNSRDIESIMKRKYPKSSFSRINNDEFKMISSNGNEIAIVHSNKQGKHVILVERPSNRSKAKENVEQPVSEGKSLSEAKFGNRYNSHYMPHLWHGEKERENDEVMRRPSKSYPAYTPPKKDHYLVVKSHTPLDTPAHEGIKVGEHTYAVPVTKDDHDKANALFPSYHSSHDDSEVISDEDYRSRELPKYRKSVMSKVLPGVDAEFVGARKTAHQEKNDHYALLHVPAGAEEDVKKLPNVKVSPKGRYYTMIPKSVHEMDTTNKNISVGDMVGYHDINNVNNPKRHMWAPNYNMDHAIKVEKTLSPEDIIKMKKEG